MLYFFFEQYSFMCIHWPLNNVRVGGQADPHIVKTPRVTLTLHVYGVYKVVVEK